jgi:hypothetical protein
MLGGANRQGIKEAILRHETGSGNIVENHYKVMM